MTREVKDYLTDRQKEILDFINEFRDQRGISPTHREICERFGYSSYGTVYKHLKLLEDKGFLRRDQNQKRGIELVRVLRGAEATVDHELPFLGRIAAGKPIEAVSGNETLAVPSHLIAGRAGEHYVLRVVGDSMIEEGIHNGDYVVVLRREHAQAGEMVVALVGSDATLKRIYPEGRRVRLQPANPNMEAIYVPANDVKVQGIVVGLMRKF
ncbi:MAG: transcriptional repressor LexA [Thermoanaerobaculia bacterium]|nr:transcriptional repressor LexA [Thermoanaerobaculia bacterium]